MGVFLSFVVGIGFQESVILVVPRPTTGLSMANLHASGGGGGGGGGTSGHPPLFQLP